MRRAGAHVETPSKTLLVVARRYLDLKLGPATCAGGGGLRWDTLAPRLPGCSLPNTPTERCAHRALQSTPPQEVDLVKQLADSLREKKGVAWASAKLEGTDGESGETDTELG